MQNNDTLNDSVDSPASASNSDTELSNASNEQSMEDISDYKDEVVLRAKTQADTAKYGKQVEQQQQQQSVSKRNSKTEVDIKPEEEKEEHQGVKKRLSKKLSRSTENVDNCGTQYDVHSTE